MLTRLVPAAIGAASILLAGCGAGQVSQTAEEVAAVNGANGNIGPIAIRDAELAPPPKPDNYYRRGSDAPLLLTIVNTGGNDDKLVSVSSPDAKGAKIVGDRTIPSRGALRSGKAIDESGLPSSKRATSPAPSGAASKPSPESNPVPAPSAPQTSAVAPRNPSSGAVPTSNASTSTMPTGQMQITLTGLQVRKLRTGVEVPVVFTFAKAGKVTVPTPIATSLHPGAG